MALGNGFCLLVASMLLIINGIGGRRTHKAEKQLNDPSTKAIKTEYGDIYDCVDFYKQPAFDHPLLKNHKFHPRTKPSFRSRWETAIYYTVDKSKIGLKDEGCPSGTVPIRRTSYDDIVQAQMLSENYASSIHPFTSLPKPGTHHAIVQTKSNPATSVFHGIKGNLSVYNPTVLGYQYSSGFMSVQDGADILQVGWMVNPSLYKDKQTRMFIHTNTAKAQCFNTYCPGFVLVRRDVPPDMVLSYSTPGGPTHAYGFMIYQDSKSGNWWLTLRDGRVETDVGFWPKHLFTGLAEAASTAACGGATYSPPGHLNPPMGSGSYVLGDTRYDAYCANFAVVNNEYKFVDFDTEKFSDSDGYEVQDKRTKGAFGHLVSFGGPGGRPS